jgi:phage baseplate assembly protein V
MPDVGEFVLCLFLPYAPETGFVIGSYYDKKHTPPICSNDTYYKQFNDGTEIFYDRKSHLLKATVNGDIEISGNTTHITTITTHDGDVTINGKVTINGDVQVMGNITASQQISDLNGSQGTMSKLRNTYNIHTHMDDNNNATQPPNEKV